jgi:hypothetical protein
MRQEFIFDCPCDWFLRFDLMGLLGLIIGLSCSCTFRRFRGSHHLQGKG